MIVVGNMQFKDKDELYNSTKKKLETLNGLILEEGHIDFQYFVDLFHLHHDVASKIGDGIKGFRISKNPINKKAMATFLIRNDGTEIDFSWKNCCTQVWKKDKRFYYDAMRSSIVRTKPYAKNECEICKTVNGPFEKHHATPFRNIADQFIKEHPEILKAKLTNGVGTYFHCDSKDIEQLWIDYHDTVVRWMYLCRTCHNKEDKKLKVKEQNMNNIQITISAPELVQAMQALTMALQSGTVKPAQVESVIEKLETEAQKPVDKPSKPNQKPKADEAPTATLEDVRKMLSTLSQSGKQSEVRQLIALYGATKLTEIDPANYQDLIDKAGAL
jgi:hypothetical protein